MVLIGLIVNFIMSFIGGGLGGLSSNPGLIPGVKLTADQVAISGYVGIAVMAAMWILIIVGLAKASKYSSHYKGALIALIIAIIYEVVLAGGVYYMTGKSGGTAELIGNKTYLIGFAAASLIGLIISIIYNRKLIMGCADLAGANGETELVRKCRGTWMFYLFSMILLIIGLAAMGAGYKFLIEVFNHKDNLDALNLDIWAIPVFAGGILVMLSVFLQLIAQLRIIFRVSGVRKALNGKSFPIGYKAAA